LSDQPAASCVHRVTLASVLDLRAAAPLASELKACRGADVEIDASAVDRVGAQCVQVLLSAYKSWTEDGNRFGVVTSSSAFSKGIELLGVELPQTK
jgi:chemotaxis protein CheX